MFGVAVLGAVVNGQLTANLKGRLHALGIPPQFDSIVIHAVTHGTAPTSSKQAAKINPAAAAAPQLVEKVLHAAERAFYSGLHLALLISAGLLLLGAVVAFFGCRPTKDGEATPSEDGDDEGFAEGHPAVELATK